MIKLIILIAMGAGGAVFVIARLLIGQVAKASAQTMINKVRKDPSFARTISEELDIPVSTRREFSETEFALLKQYLVDQKQVGNYKILHTADVNAKQFIVFSEVTYVDFSAGLSGEGQDVKKTEYINFLISLDEESTLTVRTPIYHSANEKFLKEGFLPAVFDGRKTLGS